MKTTAILISILGLTLGSLCANPPVPLVINYQGTVTDGAGIPLGSAGVAPNFTPAPVNRAVIFRIFDKQNGGALKWSEQQIVTISLGQFSVLLGKGTDAVYAGNTEARPSLDTVFTGGDAEADGPARFLEIVVDEGSGTLDAADTPITPRQRITTTAYSFKSMVAETVAANAINSQAIADGAITGVKIINGAVTGDKIANSSITSAKLDPSIGLWAASGTNVYRGSGNVGIGTSAPGFPLNFAPNTGDKISLYGNSGAHFGFGIGPALLQIHADNANSDIAFGYGSSSAMTETMRIKGNGNVGIGTPTPTVPLSFSSTLGDKISLYGNKGSHFGFGIQSNLMQIHGNGPSTDIAFGHGSGSTMTETLRIKGNGRVGIGTSTPGYPLSIRPATGDLIELGGWDAAYGGNHFGFGISGLGALQIHTPIQANDIVFGWGRSAAMTETMRIRGNGRVGIGISDPLAALHVAGATFPTYLLEATLEATGASNQPGNSRSDRPFSIISDNNVRALAFDVNSDERVKNILAQSESAADLKSLMKIQVTDYKFKDVLANGATPQKKVIAQQVERIYPQAVSKSTDVVPDIYQKAAIRDGWVTLPTDLKSGERVRLISENGQSIHEVLEVADGKFRTDFATEGDEVFVYGREVNDFRSVDYDAIAMLNVSATQQIKKEKDAEVNALREENAALRARLAALEARDQERETKLSSIELRLDALAPAVIRTVAISNDGRAR